MSWVIYFMESDVLTTSLTVRDAGQWNHMWWCVCSSKFWECEVVYKHSHCGLFCHFLLKTHSISQTERRKKIHPYSTGLKVMVTLIQQTNYWWFYSLFVFFLIDQNFFNTFIASVLVSVFFLSRICFFSCISFTFPLVLPCCLKPVILCPSQRDGVFCSDPAACSGGASWCALFSKEEKKKEV